MIVIWGPVHFGVCSPLQGRIVEQAKGAPNLASTLNQGAFNFGNALGAALGGLVLTAGFGYPRRAWASAAVSTLALGVAFIALRYEHLDKTNRSRSTQSSQAVR